MNAQAIEDAFAELQLEWRDYAAFQAEYDKLLNTIGNVEGHEVMLLSVVALINIKAKLPTLVQS